MLLQFAEKNPGMTRVMVGDALVFENERLQQRMNQFFDKIESTLKQSLRGGADGDGSATPALDAQVRASMLTAFVVGRLQRFARSGLQARPFRAPGSQPGAHALNCLSLPLRVRARVGAPPTCRQPCPPRGGARDAPCSEFALPAPTSSCIPAVRPCCRLSKPCWLPTPISARR